MLSPALLLLQLHSSIWATWEKRFLSFRHPGTINQIFVHKIQFVPKKHLNISNCLILARKFKFLHQANPTSLRTKIQLLTECVRQGRKTARHQIMCSPFSHLSDVYKKRQDDRGGASTRRSIWRHSKVFLQWLSLFGEECCIHEKLLSSSCSTFSVSQILILNSSINEQQRC